MSQQPNTPLEAAPSKLSESQIEQAKDIARNCAAVSRQFGDEEGAHLFEGLVFSMEQQAAELAALKEEVAHLIRVGEFNAGQYVKMERALHNAEDRCNELDEENRQKDKEIEALNAQLPRVVAVGREDQEQFRDEVEVNGKPYGMVGFDRKDGKDWVRITSREDGGCFMSSVIRIPLNAAPSFVALMAYILAHKTRPDEHSRYAFPPPAQVLAEVEKEGQG